MTPLMMLVLCLVMLATSFLSGIFGMAGGMILIGVLLVLLPVQTAMVLHAVTQMASNGWRGLLWRKHVRWRPVAFFVSGCLLALTVWSLTRYVPSTPVALILLGVTPFLVKLFPADWQPNPESRLQATAYGTVCMTLMLLTGVAGPLIDSFFLGSGKLDRREIVATKAMCQVIGHGLKLAYFGSIIEQAGMLDPVLAVLAIVSSMVGTTVAKRFLEMMSDGQYRLWAGRIIATIAGYYIIHGMTLLVISETSAR
ncbi:MAG: TSUP family transporter [Rhizobiales bacterium]|nr:TSUP family transporter [Hyphomicrobiales bacterium]